MTGDALDLSGVDEAYRARFWPKVNVTQHGCWEWRASGKGNGYGQFFVRKGVPIGAHRVSYALAYGSVPAGMVVCHRCDNPPCVRPDHLFLGSQLDNAVDSVIKGRAHRAKGEVHPKARLTDGDINVILDTPQYRGVNRDLAARFGVHRDHISRIRRGKKWAHRGGRTS